MKNKAAKINFYWIREETDFIVFLRKISLMIRKTQLLMKRFVLIAFVALILFGFSGYSLAQRNVEIPNLKGKVVYGGNFGFGMSGNHLSLAIAPQLGYRVFHPWEIGARAIYDLSCNFSRVQGNTYGHYFGVAPYTNFEIYRGLFVHVEDEVMYGIVRWNHETVSEKWYNTVFVGGGYRQYSYNGSYVYFLALYNLSWGVLQTGSWDTPYGSPISIRVGYCF